MAFPGVRARGTVGGSIAHADPASELPAVLLALGGEVVARGPGGERTIPADDLFVTYFTTALQPDEVLTHVRFPRDDVRTGFAEVARKAGDFALAGAAVALAMDGGTCRSARVALFGVADRPLRATGAEQALAGRTPAEARRGGGQARVGGDRCEIGLARHGPVPQGRRRSARRASAGAGGRGGLMATIVEGENVVRLTVNGEERRGIAEPRTLLSDFLRARARA